MENVPQHFHPRRDFLLVLGVFIVLIGLLHLWASTYLLRLPNIIDENMFSEDKEYLAKIPVDFLGHGYRLLVASGVLYGLYALVIVLLGFGSILAKRWSVKILHALGWVTVAVGVHQFIVQLLTIPLMASVTGLLYGTFGLGGGVLVSGIIRGLIQAVVVLLLFAGPGALLIVVYGRKNIDFTCQSLNPRPSWSDRVSFKRMILLVLFVFYIAFAIMYLVAIRPLMQDLKIIPNQAVFDVLIAGGIVLLAILSFGVYRSAKWAWIGSLGYFIACLGLWFYLSQGVDYYDWFVALFDDVFAGLYEDGEKVWDAFGLDQNQFETYFRSIVDSISNFVIMVSSSVFIGIIGYVFYIRNEFGKKEGVEST